MTVDEAIEMYANNAEYERTHGSLQGCMDFRQLAEWLKDYKRLLEQQPCEDMVSLGVFKQVMWERDVAIEQLKELGYGFGEKTREDGDTISRQKTIEAFEKWICSDYKDDYPIMSFIGIQTILEEQPSVNPQPKTGHWIEEIDDYGKVMRWHCDKCYQDSGFTTTCKWDFCPNCGAKMIDPQERNCEPQERSK